MSALRTIYRYWVSILAAAVAVQVGLAGYGAFYAVDKLSEEGSSISDKTFEDGFGAHMGLGYLIVLGGLLALILVLLARPGRRTVTMTAAVFGLLILQVLLAWFGSELPAIGALHPLNAFLILGLLGALAVGEWRMARGGMGAGRPATTAPPPA